MRMPSAARTRGHRGVDGQTFADIDNLVILCRKGRAEEAFSTPESLRLRIQGDWFNPSQSTVALIEN